MARPAHPHEELCPPHRQIRDKYPAGYLTLCSAFLQRHRQEILSLARHEAQSENAEYPLHRIMQMEEQDDHIVITTDLRAGMTQRWLATVGRVLREGVGG